MGTEVKFMHSAMTGAPSLTGTAGSMIAVLDACLKDGFGLGTLDSLVVSGGIATATRASGHPFEVGSAALMAGSTPTELNGEKRVLSVTGTTYTFDATGVADGAATGTITHKMAPLGWTKLFSATNLAAYKPSDPTATGCVLRVDDTGATDARVVGYESMSDVNTGVGPFPTTAQVSGGAFWGKSQTANSTVREWMLFGDSRGFALSLRWNTSGAGYNTAWFGDFTSYKGVDPHACALTGETASTVGSAAGSSTADLAYCEASSDHKTWLCRGASGLGSSQVARRTAAVPSHSGTQGFSGSNTNFIAYPNPADTGLFVVQPWIVEPTASRALRGVQPGAYYCPQNIGTATIANKDSVTGVTGLTGRTLKAVLSSSGVSFYDITGPWR